MKSGLEGKLSSLWTIRYWSVGKGAVTDSRTLQDQDKLALLPTCCNRLNGCCVTIGLTLSTINPAVGVAKVRVWAVKGLHWGGHTCAFRRSWGSICGNFPSWIIHLSSTQNKSQVFGFHFWGFEKIIGFWFSVFVEVIAFWPKIIGFWSLDLEQNQ